MLQRNSSRMACIRSARYAPPHKGHLHSCCPIKHPRPGNILSWTHTPTVTVQDVSWALKGPTKKRHNALSASTLGVFIKDQHMDDRRSDIPFFTQWETPEMTLPYLLDGPDALRHDPLWRNSGAETIDEYAIWAANICGMACLKMILAARGEVHPILSLARACTAHGGYVVNEADASIKGLIYAPFVHFVQERFGLKAEVRVNIPAAEIATIVADDRFFIASVNSAIRWPEREVQTKGGHLVLVTAASPQHIRFHNPSGHDHASQADVVLPLATFDRFFANRGIAIGF